jgi:YidC/Oxa1 family membrane protein insertase
MNDQKNLILAIILSVVIMVGYEVFFAKKPPLPDAPAKQEQTMQAPAQGPAPAAPAAGTAPQAPATGVGSAPQPPATASSAPAAPERQATQVYPARAEVLKRNPRVTIDSPRLHGSINLKGGQIDDVELKDYRTTLDPESPPVLLLSPQGVEDAYFAELGWVGSGVEVPGPDTVWTADRDTLSLNQPVTLTWSNSQGLTFSMVYSIDENFMFTVNQKVRNAGGQTVTLYPYAFVSRRTTPPVLGYFVLHEGPLAVFNNTLKEVSYADLQKDAKIETPTTGGWLGFTDKYWLAALVPDQKAEVKTRFLHSMDGTIDKYQADYLGGPVAVPAGSEAESVNRVFAGAKEVSLLDGYSEKLGIARFDLAIDFGWFYWITKPIFYALVWMHKLVGNFGIAILLLTVLIKLAFFPLANNSYKAMSRMRKLQPQMLKLRERFGEDKVRLNQEMMSLYKREKVNPAAGCLPMLVQIPVFFSLYKVLFVTIEMRHAPFFGWIKDLSVADPTNLFNLFGILPFTPPAFLHLGIWPIIMGVTMYFQMKLNPQPVDPVQAKIFQYMPILFTFMLGSFPAGLVIYWAWNNVLSMAQQWAIMKREGVA